MELYYMLAVVDRDKEKQLRDICESQKLVGVLTTFGNGTATQAHLRLHDLQPTEKSVLAALVTAPSMKQIVRAAKHKMYMDIPGNGVMMYIPVKSVSGKKTLAFFTDGQTVGGGAMPAMEFKNELIVVILNEGHANEVMDAARAVGATGGTIIHAKGTGGGVSKFFGVAVAEEKDLLYILAASGKKSQIMKAINHDCGIGTAAGAICFSLPVSETVGIRRLDDDEES